MSKEFIVKEISDDSRPYMFKFIIVDPVTKEVLDDADGKGYKTRPKASAAYRYKLKKRKKSFDC